MMRANKAFRHRGIKASGVPTARLAPDRLASSQPKRQRFASALHRAFTLVELVVVIGIVVMLVGLIVGVTVAVRAKSEIRQVENTLKLLDMALREWETAADRQFTWWANGYNLDGTPNANAKYDLNAFQDGEHQMSAALARFQATSSAKEILARLDPDLFVTRVDPATNQPRAMVLDPWDKEMIIVHPGRLWMSADPLGDKDTDATLHTRATTFASPPPDYEIYEDRFGTCVNRRICLVCAGPDGKFGNVTAAPDTLLYKQSQDNIYSYPLVRP